MINIEEKKKQVIGLYGKMRLSMELHELGWQVHRAYIDVRYRFCHYKILVW